MAITCEAYRAVQLYHFTDTGDDGAQNKITGAYALHKGRLGLRDLEPPKIVLVPSTLAIGVQVSEVFNSDQRPQRLILNVNAAGPDKAEGTENNARNPFYSAELSEGVFINGTSNGFELSFVKPCVTLLHELTTSNNHGTQFRSYVVLPRHSLDFYVQEERQRLIDRGDLGRIGNIDSVVQSLPDRTFVFEIDEPFKNVKLYLAQSAREFLAANKDREITLEFGHTSVELAGNTKQRIVSSVRARVTETLFEGRLGENVIALNSSSHLSSGVSSGTNVPILATIRKHPAETPPNYKVPKFGVPVSLSKPSTVAFLRRIFPVSHLGFGTSRA